MNTEIKNYIDKKFEELKKCIVNDNPNINSILTLLWDLYEGFYDLEYRFDYYLQSLGISPDDKFEECDNSLVTEETVDTNEDTPKSNNRYWKDGKQLYPCTIRGFKIGNKQGRIIVSSIGNKEDVKLEARNFIKKWRPELLEAFDYADENNMLVYEAYLKQPQILSLLNKSKMGFDKLPLLISDNFVVCGRRSQGCELLPNLIKEFWLEFQPDIPLDEDNLCRVKDYLQ